MLKSIDSSKVKAFTLLATVSAVAYPGSGFAQRTFNPSVEAISTQEMRKDDWRDLRQLRANRFCQSKGYLRARKLRTNRPEFLSSKAGKRSHSDLLQALNEWTHQNGEKTFKFTEITCTKTQVDQPSNEPSCVFYQLPSGIQRAEKAAHEGIELAGIIPMISEADSSNSASSSPRSASSANSSPKNRSKMGFKIQVGKIDGFETTNQKKAGSKRMDKSVWELKHIPTPEELKSQHDTDDMPSLNQVLFHIGPKSAQSQKEKKPEPGITYEFRRPKLALDFTRWNLNSYETALMNQGEQPRDYYLRRLKLAGTSLNELPNTPLAQGRQSTVFRLGSGVIKFKAASLHSHSTDPEQDLLEMALQAKRDLAMSEFVDLYSKNFKVGGRNPVTVAKYEKRPEEISQGIFRQEFLTGPSAYQVAEWIQIVESQTDSSAVKNAKAKLTYEFGSVEAAKKQVKTLETFYQVINSDALIFQKKNDLPIPTNALDKMASYSVGVDLLGGRNSAWKRDTQQWGLYDL